MSVKRRVTVPAGKLDIRQEYDARLHKRRGARLAGEQSLRLAELDLAETALRALPYDAIV
jgi:hypothetical protein